LAKSDTLIFIALFSVPAPVNAESSIYMERTRIVGAGAYAEFGYEEAGVWTFVNVNVNDSTILTPPQPGGPEPSRFANVSVFRYVAETGQVLLGASGETEEFQFTFSRDLTTARLVADVPGWDVDGWLLTFKVDLSWEATGELEDGNSHFLYQERGFLLQVHTNGEFRDGIATGTIEARGENLIHSYPSTSAQVQNSKAGSLILQITKP
jgi:hypothetical protein